MDVRTIVLIYNARQLGGQIVEYRGFLLFLFCWQFHDKAVQTLWQALLVIVGLLSRNVDGLQGCAAFESFLANFLNTSGEFYSFQSDTVTECVIFYLGNRTLDNYRFQAVASFEDITTNFNYTRWDCYLFYPRMVKIADVGQRFWQGNRFKARALTESAFL